MLAGYGVRKLSTVLWEGKKGREEGEGWLELPRRVGLVYAAPLSGNQRAADQRHRNSPNPINITPPPTKSADICG